ncbi:MAG: DNA double-strand break repair nuclease NurA [Promethearchaeota archaeon]
MIEIPLENKLIGSSSPKSMSRQLEDIAKIIRKAGLERKKLAECLTRANNLLADLPIHYKDMICEEEFLYQEVTQSDLNGLTICGIDGGLIAKSLLGADVLLIRAIAVVFTYGKEGIFKTTYFPSKLPELKLGIYTEALGSREFDSIAGLMRIQRELDTAFDLLSTERKHIDVIIMDGALRSVIHSYKRSSRNPEFQKQAIILQKKLKEFLTLADKEDTLIAWSIKDSRTSEFLTFLGRILPYLASNISGLLDIDYRKVLNTSRDIDLFYFLLPLRARSFVMHLEEEKNPLDPTLETSIYSFFLKCAPYDAPLRIEFAYPRSKKHIPKIVNKIASVLLPLSQFHVGYSVPAPIVEADGRARIRLEEFETIVGMLQRRTNQPGLWVQRRNRSPFKF